MPKKRRQDYPLWMTPSEVAEMMRISRSTIYEELRQNKLPYQKIGNQYRIDRDALFFGARRGAE